MFFSRNWAVSRSRVWSVYWLTASCTCTCRIRCVPPCKSKPSLMRFAKFDFKTDKDFGASGIPTKPIKQTRMTAAMKIAFHLRFEFMAWAGSGLRRNVLSLWGLEIEPTPVILALLLLLAFRLESGHRGAQYFHFYLIGDTKLNRVALNAHDCTEQPAAGDDFIPVFERAQHFLSLLLTPLRGKDQQHVKDHHDDEKRREGHQPTGARALGHE